MQTPLMMHHTMCEWDSCTCVYHLATEAEHVWQHNSYVTNRVSRIDELDLSASAQPWTGNVTTDFTGCEPNEQVEQQVQQSKEQGYINTFDLHLAATSHIMPSYHP